MVKMELNRSVFAGFVQGLMVVTEVRASKGGRFSIIARFR